MNPALNGRTTLQHFERDNTVEICNGMMFNFYPGLPHMNLVKYLYVPMPSLPPTEERFGNDARGGRSWLNIVAYCTCMMFKNECMFVLQNMGHWVWCLPEVTWGTWRLSQVMVNVMLYLYTVLWVQCLSKPLAAAVGMSPLAAAVGMSPLAAAVGMSLVIFFLWDTTLCWF